MLAALGLIPILIAVAIRISGGSSPGRGPAFLDQVAGNGLFVGVELVADRDQRTPDGPAASYVANRMRELGVLMSTDGPDHNVLKIKPPLCFDRSNAEMLADTLGRVLGESMLNA